MSWDESGYTIHSEKFAIFPVSFIQESGGIPPPRANYSTRGLWNVHIAVARILLFEFQIEVS
jgi:hypothetical protein